MFVFVFSPKANRESLREFNGRLHEFCADNPVVSIDATAFGDNLIIQGVTADDTDASGVPTFTATVRTMEQDANDLEEQLDSIIDQEKAKHSDEDDGDPNMPIKVITCAGPKKAWAVVLCINGVAEDDDDKGGGGGDDGETPEPSPVPAPAAGFQG